MKFPVEVDLSKGSGSLRWEGVTARRVRRVASAVVTVVAVLASIQLTRWYL
jgi:hypothetical protein